jgi:hypothetical protein
MYGVLEFLQQTNEIINLPLCAKYTVVVGVIMQRDIMHYRLAVATE